MQESRNKEKKGNGGKSLKQGDKQRISKPVEIETEASSLSSGEPFQAEFRTRVNTKTTIVRFGLEWNNI